jgi:hypothetical protein
VIAGILILILPRLLNYIAAIYLILIGLAGLFGQFGGFQGAEVEHRRPHLQIAGPV